MNRKPNILFILMDDMGWRDLSCCGSMFYETPIIDQLADEGIQFTNAYAACPVCSPTRASIMTGKYPATVGLTDYLVSNARGYLIDAPYLHHLPLEEKCLARALKDNGYDTWHVGKWHLGTEEYYPEKHGFDVNIGGCEFGLPRSGYYSPYNIPTLEDGPEHEYLTDRLTDEAVKLISESTDKPFFLNLCHYAVHVPIQIADDALVEKYRKKAADMGLDKVKTFEEGDFFPCESKKDKRIVRRLVQSDPYYAAMIENLDNNIGRVLDALKESGKMDETIIIFTSDNGGLATAEGSPTCNKPVSEGKGWMYDGGLRVPLVIRWPEAIRAGTKCDEPVISSDFYPTLLEAACIELMPQQHVDGVSLMPALEGNEEFERGPVFWHYPHYGNQGGTPGCAVRFKNYKLLYFFEKEDCELYDYDRDMEEKYDISKIQPDVCEKLRKMLFDWLDQIEAKFPTKNPDFVPWREGKGSGADVELPFDSEKYDADVYYGIGLDRFH